MAYARAHNFEHQLDLLKIAVAITSQDRYALIVVGNFIALTGRTIVIAENWSGDRFRWHGFGDS